MSLSVDFMDKPGNKHYMLILPYNVNREKEREEFL